MCKLTLLVLHLTRLKLTYFRLLDQYELRELSYNLSRITCRK